MRSSWTRSGGGTASSVKHCDITCTAGSSNRPCDSTPPEPQSSVVPSYVTPRTAQPTVGFRINGGFPSHWEDVSTVELDEVIGFASWYGSDHAFEWRSRVAESFDEQRNRWRSAERWRCC